MERLTLLVYDSYVIWQQTVVKHRKRLNFHFCVIYWLHIYIIIHVFLVNMFILHAQLTHGAHFTLCTYQSTQLSKICCSLCKYRHINSLITYVTSNTPCYFCAAALCKYYIFIYIFMHSSNKNETKKRAHIKHGSRRCAGLKIGIQVLEIHLHNLADERYG